MNINSHADYTFCGLLGVSNSLKVNSNGEMMVAGTLAFGSGNSWMSVNSNAHLKIQGDLIINGNLNSKVLRKLYSLWRSEKDLAGQRIRFKSFKRLLLI